MGLPGYDEWKLASPDDNYCEFCGVHQRALSAGWQPTACTGECGRSWRDPDYERDRQRDERDGR